MDMIDSSPAIRLKEFINLKYSTQKDFADAIGIELNGLAQYIGEGKKSTLGNKYINKLTELGLNLNWYISGVGPMTVDDMPVINNHNKGVPYYPIDVTASLVRSFNDISEKPEYFIDFRPFNDCTAYFPIYGDSMYPMFKSGQIIAVKNVLNFSIIQWGEAYLVITDETANNMRTVKLVFPHDDTNFIILRASNPNFKGDIVIPRSAVINLFIVKGSIERRLM